MSSRSPHRSTSATTTTPPTASSSELLLKRFVPTGDEMALKTALYQSLFLVLLGVGVAGAYAIYHMMFIFLRPMLWATLIGTVLFPFKRKVTNVLREWLEGLRCSHTPLAVGVVLLPYRWLDSLAEQFWALMACRTGAYVVLAFLTLKLLTYERAFMSLFSLLSRLYNLVDKVIWLFSTKWMIPVIVLYGAAYVAWVYVQPDGHVNKKLARVLSIPLWLFSISFLAGFFGPLRVVMFVGCCLTIVLLAAGLIGAGGDDEDDSDQPMAADDPAVTTTSSSDGTERSDGRAPLKRKDSVQEVLEHVLDLDEALTSDAFLQIIFGLCFLLWTVRHGWMLTLLSVPLIYAFLKKAGSASGFFSSIERAARSTWESAHTCARCEPVFVKMKKIVEVTVAGPVRQFFRLLFTSERKFIGAIERSLDVVSSVVVMLALLVGSVAALLFIAFQLHGETVHLVKLGTNVLQSQPDWLASAVNYTEDQLAEHDIDDYIEQAYTQGREWLSSKARSLASPSDPERADLLESQVNTMVDNVYMMWKTRYANISSTLTADTKQVSSADDFLTHLKHATDLAALKQEISHIIQENMDTLMTIAQSVWGVLAMNVSFLSNIIFAMLGVVFSFGMDIVHLVIEIVVFLTVVYYLLASSKDQWLPLEWMNSLTPQLVGAQLNPGSGADTVSEAIEQSIRGVFVLSAKMAIFYGLYTWFVHALFDLNIVFVPAILASMFAAVPIMQPYLVSVIGVIELYWVRDETAAAIVFALASFAPVLFVDGAFYKEVKGSHPYVTGLAIIGGMYWLGLEGALIGPILLCCMLVLVHVYAGFAHPTPTSSAEQHKHKVL